MTEEDKKNKTEIFYNKILARDEITKLLEPKVLRNIKIVKGENNEQELTEFKKDEQGNIKDNLLIKGNNLLALHTIKQNFAGKVKLIYIDPPYNIDADAFYNDKFNHSMANLYEKPFRGSQRTFKR